jgi:branched-subunit amino acid transport protein
VSPLDIWLSIAVLTLGTVLTRATFWVVGHHITIPHGVHEALRFAPACALAAIIVPDLLFDHDQIVLNFHNPKLVGGIVASAWFLYRRGMFSAILVGMTVFTLVRLTM